MTVPRVLVTRAAEDADPLVQALGNAGLQAVVAPLLTRIWHLDEITDLAGRAPTPAWVLLTSPAVADVVAAAAPAAWSGAKWAAVGPQTARRATALGLPVHVTTAGTGVDLARALGPLGGLQVVLPRGDLAGEDLPMTLRAAGAEVVEAIAYDNALPHGAGPRVLAALPVEATALLSGSAAERLAAIVPSHRRSELGRIAVIGPSTRLAAERAGLRIQGTASTPTAEAVVELLARWFYL